MSEEGTETAVVDAPEKTASESRSQSQEFNAVYDREALIGHLPEGYDKERFSKYLDKTADPYVAFKNYSNLEKMKSKGLPNASWEDEDYAALNKALGVPDNPDGYQFGEGVQLDEESGKFIKDFAHKAGFTPKQAEMAAELLQQVRSTESAQAEEKREQATSNMVEYLSSEWGHPDSQAYQNNFNLVSSVLESFGIKDGSEASDAIWSGPPQIVSILKEYAEMLDPQVLASWGVGDTATSKSIDQQLNELSAQMYKYDSGSKEYKDMDAKYNRLHAQRERMR